MTKRIEVRYDAPTGHSQMYAETSSQPVNSEQLDQMSRTEMESSPLGYAQSLKALHRVFRLGVATGDLRVFSSKFLRQLRERIHPLGVRDVRLARYAEGTELLVDLGDRLGADVYYGYYPEIADLVLLQRACPDDGIAVDVGANCGFFSVLLSSRARFKGRLIAIEPAAEAVVLLEKNLALARARNVSIRPECIGGSDGETQFYVAEESAFSGVSDTGRSNVRRVDRVKQLRLDTMLRELGIESISVIKIDVEGHESDVIDGALTVISKSPELVALVEVSRKNLNAERREKLVHSVSKLQGYGFQGWQIDGRRQPAEWVRVQHPGTDDIAGNNVFFVREGSAAEKRLQSEFDDLKSRPEGRSYLSGDIISEDAPTEDLLAIAERLALAALAKERADRLRSDQQYAKLEREYSGLKQAQAQLEREYSGLKQAQAQLQSERATLQRELETWQAIARRNLWHRIARFLGYKS
jgi:FkbM family methyltransferase